MKKILLGCLLALGAALTLAGAEAEPAVVNRDAAIGVGIWYDCPESLTTTDVSGFGLGLPLIVNGDLSGFSLALCGNRSLTVSGFQFALLGFNYAESLYGVQLSLLNFQKGQHGDFAFQMGFYNQAEENGVQFGLINNARNNATFQFGLFNINKRGLLPVMLLFNFGRSEDDE